MLYLSFLFMLINWLAESKLESPLMSPFASRRNSSDEKDVIVFPSSASAFVLPISVSLTKN